MGLKEYHRKRDFGLTPEPRGEELRREGRSFCIQKHAASHLHYDFRLELEGVLKSWSVPKGPSFDQSVKRLAMMTEDHPVDYGDFEGIIPKGQYGGGTVLLWDRGTWEPLGNPHEMLRAGNLKFRLHGEKLQGGWALVRIKGKGARDEGRSWLLLKERDEAVRAASEYDVTEARPESVATGRSMDEIAAERDRVWDSNRGDSVGTREDVAAVRKRQPAAPKKPLGTRAALPPSVEPQLATLVDEAPGGAGWVHEMKYDGYRILARVQGGRTRLLSRNGKDWTDQFPEVAEAVSALPLKQALVDGEVAMLLPSGLTSFQALQNRGTGDGRIVYLVFDLLHKDGRDLRRLPLLERKAALQPLVSGKRNPLVRYSEHVGGPGDAFLREACRLGLEGIISKRADAPYERGRARSWVKVKCHQHQELVIGGFTEPTGSRVGIGALLVGIPDGGGALTYAGKVGTGFTDKVLRELYQQLGKRERKVSPFAGKIPGAGRAHWVEPELVAEVEFTEWTSDGKLRHPSYRGLRADKDVASVAREKPAAAAPEATKTKAAAKSGRVGRKTKKVPGLIRAADDRPVRSGTPRAGTNLRIKGEAAEVAGVRITNPDRVIYPEQGITKLALAQFYERIADQILPHIEGRPTTLVRCPGGLAEPCFYQKHTGIWAPEDLRRVFIQEKTKKGEYLVVDSLQGLIGLAQIGILEIHTWNSRADTLEKPDRLVFDLDPDEGLAWARVVDAARRVRALLQDLGLVSFVKTTGGKGLHVVVPLGRGITWDESNDFSAAVASRLVRESPEAYTDVMSKARRKGKLYVDYLRNTRGATAVAAWSTRAKPLATVSTPIAWEELKPSLDPTRFTLLTIPARLQRRTRDPWQGYFGHRQRLTAAMKKEITP